MEKRELSSQILSKFEEVSKIFEIGQVRNELACPNSCSKCCMKPDISCAPFELLPLAFHLIDTQKAEDVLMRAREHDDNHCFFLDVYDKKLGTGRCLVYEFRPFICRAFGLSARLGKKGESEISICSTLNEMANAKDSNFRASNEIPFIDFWKKKFESITPQLLENEIPINEGIVILLEKLLLLKQYGEL